MSHYYCLGVIKYIYKTVLINMNSIVDVQYIYWFS